MIGRFGESVFSRVSVPFKQAIVVEPSFPVTVVVTIRSHGLYIEDGLVVLWHGASDATLLKLSVVLDIFVEALSTGSWLGREKKQNLMLDAKLSHF